MRNQNLRQLVEAETPRRSASILGELARETDSQGRRKLRLGDRHENGCVSLGELYEAFVGMEKLQIAHRERGYVEMVLSEDAAVGHTLFSNITGVLLGNELIDAYENASKIGDSLVAEYSTNLREERLAGFQRNGDVATVNEGDDYPRVGMSDKYITLGSALKRGEIIDVTEEAVFYDQTGALLDNLRQVGEDVAYDKETKILEMVTGEVNSYFPSGAETAIYQAAPYLIASNPLVDWTSIETALNSGFAAMTDERGKPIGVMPDAILVPTALLFTAKRVVGATEIEQRTPTDGTAGTSAQANITRSASPVSNLQIFSSIRVSGVQSSNGTSNWFLGNFKKQFRWKRVWPFQVFQRQANSEQQFERDIVTGYKWRYLGNGFTKDIRYVVKCQAGA